MEKKITDIDGLIHKWEAQKNRLRESLYNLWDEARSIEAKIEQLDRCIRDLKSGLGDTSLKLALGETASLFQKTDFLHPRRVEFVLRGMTNFQRTLKSILLVKEKIRVTEVPTLMRERGYTFTAKNTYISAYDNIKNSPHLFRLHKEKGKVYVESASNRINAETSNTEVKDLQ